MSAPVDVLAVLAFAVGKEGSKPPPSPDRFDDALAAVAELVAADREYEDARKDWDRATASHPGDISEKSWQRIADRFEAAVMRRAAALAKFGGAA